MSTRTALLKGGACSLPIFLVLVSKVLDEVRVLFFYSETTLKNTPDGFSCLRAMCFDMVIESKCYSVSCVQRERERGERFSGSGGWRVRNIGGLVYTDTLSFLLGLLVLRRNKPSSVRYQRVVPRVSPFGVLLNRHHSVIGIAPPFFYLYSFEIFWWGGCSVFVRPSRRRRLRCSSALYVVLSTQLHTVSRSRASAYYSKRKPEGFSVAEER